MNIPARHFPPLADHGSNGVSLFLELGVAQKLPHFKSSCSKKCESEDGHVPVYTVPANRPPALVVL